MSGVHTSGFLNSRLRPAKVRWLPLILAGFLLLAGRSIAALEVEKMIEAALANSPELKRRQDQVSALQLTLQEKKGSFNPTVSLGVSHSESDRSASSRTYVRADDMSIRVEQPLYQSSLWRDYREAAVNIRIGEARCRETHDQVILETLLALLEIYRFSCRLALNHNSLGFVLKAQELQQKAWSAGWGSKLAVSEAEVEIARHRKERESLLNQLKMAVLRWEQLTALDGEAMPGAMANDVLSLPDPPQLDPVLINDAEQAIEHHPRLVLARLQQELGLIQLGRSRDYWKPEVALSLNHLQSRNDGENGEPSIDNTVALNLRLSFSTVQAYFRERRLTVEQDTLKNEIARTRVELQDQHDTFTHRLGFQQSLWVTQRQWVAKQQEICGLYQKGLEQRQVTLSKVLEAGRTGNESRIELVESFVAIWEAVLQWRQLVGFLTPAVL